MPFIAEPILSRLRLATVHLPQMLGAVVISLSAALLLAACGGEETELRASAERRQPLAVTGEDEIEILFDWAEKTYPHLFPDHTATQILAPYRYRYYAGTGNYVGIADGLVSVLGPVSGGRIQAVGSLEEFRCQVRPGVCIQGGVERMQVTSGVGLARSFGLDSRGRLLVADGVGLATYIDSVALSDSSMRLVASDVRQVRVGGLGGMYVTSDGRANAWGSPVGGWMGGLYNPALQSALVTTPRAMPWPGAVRQVAFAKLSVAALLEDGSLWDMPTAPVLSTTPIRIDPRRFTGAPSLKALSHGPSGLHAIAHDGTVLKLDFDAFKSSPVAGADRVQSLACSEAHCMAVRNDGTVIAWGTGPLGDGSDRISNTAVVIPSLKGIVQVAVTDRQSLALDAEGRVWAWGSSVQGRSVSPRIVPEHAAELGVVVDVVCNAVCVLRKADGSVWYWSVGSAGSSFPQPLAVAGVRFW